MHALQTRASEEPRVATVGSFNGKTYTVGSDNVPKVETNILNLPKPKIELAKIPQTFIGPDNSSLTLTERLARVRKYQMEKNYEKLKNDISTTSPFVGGGSSNNPFGFASTFETALEETPGLVFQEYIFFNIERSLQRPVRTYIEFSKLTKGSFKTTEGIHHATLRSIAFKEYKFTVFNFNKYIVKGLGLTSSYIDIKSAVEKIDENSGSAEYKSEKEDTGENTENIPEEVKIELR